MERLQLLEAAELFLNMLRKEIRENAHSPLALPNTVTVIDIDEDEVRIKLPDAPSGTLYLSLSKFYEEVDKCEVTRDINTWKKLQRYIEYTQTYYRKSLMEAELDMLLEGKKNIANYISEGVWVEALEKKQINPDHIGTEYSLKITFTYTPTKKVRLVLGASNVFAIIENEGGEGTRIEGPGYSNEYEDIRVSIFLEIVKALEA